MGRLNYFIGSGSIVFIFNNGYFFVADIGLRHSVSELARMMQTEEIPNGM
jgi:hypothetical protein